MATEVIEPTAVEVQEDDAPKAGAPLLFQSTSWLHVGGGAEDCEGIDEEKGTNECSNPAHWHAWLRLPNQFQHKDLRDEAMAAKARKVRQLRDPESNAGGVLEYALDEVRRAAEASTDGKQAIADELAQREWWRFYQDANREVLEEEVAAEHVPADHEGDLPKRYALVERDIRRLGELQAMDPDDRSQDEYSELERHVAAYYEAVNARQRELMQPLFDELMGEDVERLVDRLRDHRIDVEANEEFMHSYSIHEWVACTFVAPRGPRKFESTAQLADQQPEVITMLKLTFDDLEQSHARSAEGN